MSIYLRNYWALYSEFITIFESVKYRGIPLSMLTNFYQQLDADSVRKMEGTEFLQELKYTSVRELAEIQPFFDALLAPLKSSVKSLPTGKIALIPEYTRLPVDTFSFLNQKDNLIILSRLKKEIYPGGFTNVCLNEYVGDVKEQSDALIQQAQKIFDEHNNHPILQSAFFRDTFLKRIPTIINEIELAFNLLSKVPVSIIIVGTTETITGRVFSLVGLMAGKPSITLQHGLLMGEEAFMPAFTSHLAVYGEYEKEWYLRRGLDENQIAVIGHPRYDSLQLSVKGIKPLDINRPTILLATGPRLAKEKIKALIDLLCKHSKYNIILKPHPWEISRKQLSFYYLYEEYEKKYKCVRLIKDSKENIHDLIVNSDLIVASQSTVGLEGMLLDKPVFVYNFLDSNRDYEYYNDLGENLEVNPEQLVKSIESYLQDEEKRKEYVTVREKFLEKRYSIENSTKELYKLIEKLTGL